MMLLPYKTEEMTMDDQERAAFEKWADLSSRQKMRNMDRMGTYMYDRIQGMWEGWQARAALAAAAPVAAQTEPDDATAWDLNLLLQWFNAVQDLNPAYLTRADYELALNIYRQLGRVDVPASVKDALAAAPTNR